ncbi:MAG: ribosome-associated heat shock protein Hsp15 [Candidatus Azotimanducaceae bacterium]|jgi:ribosome-associated heat shock protein Hsp15
MTIEKVRLDKWLWAARFFKTRAKSKEAIDGGKIHIDDVRGKPGKDIQLGDVIVIRQGWAEKTIIVKGVSEKRRGAPEAAAMYEETPESIESRLSIAAQRKAAGQHLSTEKKPSKKDRRMIHQFKERNSE